MFTIEKGGRTGAKRSRAPRTVASAAAGALVLTMLTAGPVAAADKPQDLLHVGFDGAFSQESTTPHEYVKEESEILTGKLLRKHGTETIDQGKITLAGTETGLTYESPEVNPLSTTPTGLAADKPIRAEMIFTPEDNNQPSLATLFSAGGNLFVRYDANNKIKFGFTSKTGRSWVNHVQEIDRPTPGEAHVLQVEYKPGATTTMSVKIDKADPVVVSVDGSKFSQMDNAAKNLVGFGREVHPSSNSQTRGFKGSIDAIRIPTGDAPFTFTLPAAPGEETNPAEGAGAEDGAEEQTPPEAEAPPVSGNEQGAQGQEPPAGPGSSAGDEDAQEGENQESEDEAGATTPAELFDIAFDGTFTDNTYQVGAGETAAGTLTRLGTTPAPSEGKITLAGTSTGLVFTTSEDAPLGTQGTTADKPFKAEMLFTPHTGQVAQGTLFSAGGNLFVRYEDSTKLKYGFASRNGSWRTHAQEIPLPAVDKTHLVQIEYLPEGDGAKMILTLDGVKQPEVVSTNGQHQMSAQAVNKFGFGTEVNPGGTNRGFKGTLDHVRLVPQDGAFKLSVPANTQTPAPPAPPTETPTPSDPPATTPGSGSEPSPAVELPATTTDLLNVEFGGSLTGTTQYTTQGEEVMAGVLHRIDGGEEQGLDGVTMTGGRQGLLYESRPYTMGTTRIDKSIVMEAAFIPENGQTSMGTLMAAGGNFSVRYEDGNLTYGWDHDNLPASGWSKPRSGVKAPKTKTEHVLSVHYRIKADGKAVLDAWLDGMPLDSVTGTKAANIANGTANHFGFGNDVHPSAKDRGFKGKIVRVRVAESNGGVTNRDTFKLQPKPNAEDLFRTSWDGTLADGVYNAAPLDTMDGVATAKGNARVANGNLELGAATDGIVFDPEADVLDATELNKGFLVETKFTPNGEQEDGATILSVGGNFFARYHEGKIVYGYTHQTDAGPIDVTGTAELKDETEHTVSLAYLPSDVGATVNAWVDRVAAKPLASPVKLTQKAELAGQVAFGNELGIADGSTAIKGTMAEARFAVLHSDLRRNDFSLQVLDEVCEDISHLTPANYIAVSEEDCAANIVKKAALVRPTEKQAVWQEEGLTAFIHYGINTYTKHRNGNIGIEWGHGDVPASQFAPTGDLNPEEWVKTLRDTGYRTAILVLKHHDGFMSWPTRYSPYSVKNSPWKEGKGDILREFTDAARKYGMKVGMYVSPADSHAECCEGRIHGNKSPRKMREIPTLVPGDDRVGKIPADKKFTYNVNDYNHFFLNTLYEILTEYGEVHEVWFDGATGNTDPRRPESYDYAPIYDMISKLQPGANVAVGGRDIRWIGTEEGHARYNERSVLAITGGESGGKIEVIQPPGKMNENLGTDEQLVNAVRSGSGVTHLHWWPAEADMKLTGGWFAWHNGNGESIDRPKSPRQMMNHYEQTVGRNSVLLLNVPPTVTGAFAPSSVQAIEGFAAERRKAYTLDYALGKPVTIGDMVTRELTNGNVRDGVSRPANDQTPLEVDLGEERSVHRIGLSENIVAAGQVIRNFRVEALRNGEWNEVASSGVIGSQRIIKFSAPVTAQKFRIIVTSARADYTISNVQFYGQLDSDPGLPENVYINCAAEEAGDGSVDRPFNSMEQLRKTELAPGADLHFKGGVDCEDANITVWAYGTDSNKVQLHTYGGGGAATIGGKSLSERFAAYHAQGWDVPAPVVVDTVVRDEVTVTLPEGLAFTGEVADGTEIVLNASGLVPNTEVEFWIHSEPKKIATATANEHGVASATWRVADVYSGAHTIFARTKDGTTVASLPVTVTGAPENPNPPTEQPGGSTDTPEQPGTEDPGKPEQPGTEDPGKPEQPGTENPEEPKKPEEPKRPEDGPTPGSDNAGGSSNPDSGGANTGDNAQSETKPGGSTTDDSAQSAPQSGGTADNAQSVPQSGGTGDNAQSGTKPGVVPTPGSENTGGSGNTDSGGDDGMPGGTPIDPKPEQPKPSDPNVGNSSQSGGMSDGTQSGGMSGGSSDGTQSGGMSGGTQSGGMSDGTQSGGMSDGTQSGGMSDGTQSDTTTDDTQSAGTTPDTSTKPTKSVALSSAQVAAGGTVTFTASGFTPGEKVTFEVHSEPTIAGTVTADARGVATLVWKIPANFALGEHTVYAIDSAGNKSEGVKFSVTADPSITTEGRKTPGGTTNGDKQHTPKTDNDNKSNTGSGGSKTGVSKKSLASTGATAGAAGLAALLLAGAGVMMSRRRRS